MTDEQLVNNINERIEELKRQLTIEVFETNQDYNQFVKSEINKLEREIEALLTNKRIMTESNAPCLGHAIRSDLATYESRGSELKPNHLHKKSNIAFELIENRLTGTVEHVREGCLMGIAIAKNEEEISFALERSLWPVNQMDMGDQYEQLDYKANFEAFLNSLRIEFQRDLPTCPIDDVTMAEIKAKGEEVRKRLEKQFVGKNNEISRQYGHEMRALLQTIIDQKLAMGYTLPEEKAPGTKLEDVFKI